MLGVAALLGMLSAVAAPHTAIAQSSPQAQPGGTLSPQAMDQLLAPIALYPDALILQILQCAASPYQVRQVNAWLKQNPDLQGTARQDAAAAQGFDISFVAIVLFPQVLEMMDQKPEWTQQLGQAFATDKDAVFASIQRLRTQAEKLGNLQSNAQQTVETVTVDGGQQIIVIQPANPQIVYVPQYNPQVVYVQSAPQYTATATSGDVAAAALIGFTAGVVVGALADGNHYHSYYYNCGGWGYHGACLYSSGWNQYYKYNRKMAQDYYNHRENMANDFYDHRENMAGQRGENQNNRQDNRIDARDNAAQNQADRSANRADNRDTAAQNQAGRQQNRSDARSSAADTRATNQSARQTAVGNDARTNPGAAQNRAQPAARGGSDSGAFSGYQRGSSERASSSRGRSSMAGSSANRGGGGGGGARRGGGGRR